MQQRRFVANYPQFYLALATGKSHSVGLIVSKAILNSSALALWINVTLLFNISCLYFY